MTDAADYALQLSEAEQQRYRMMAARAYEHEADLWTRAGIVEGARVADVGCGPGAVLAEIGRIVGPTGEVVGVEPGAAPRAAARHELDGLGLSFVEVRDGTGDATGLEAGAWDCVMMRHVLAHNDEAGVGAIVAHLATLVAPGGHVYLVDTDLDLFSLSPPAPGVEQEMRRYGEFQRSRGNQVNVGPQLGSLLRRAGLEVVEHQGRFQCLPGAGIAAGGPVKAAEEAMLASGHVTPEEVESADAARQRFVADPDAVMWVAIFLAIARRPA
jgi:SAM-dependent methyltransferase